MTEIDLELMGYLFELFWWFSLAVFFIVFIIKMILNFFNR